MLLPLRAYHVCAISVHDIPSWEMLMRASGLSLWFPFTLAVSSVAEAKSVTKHDPSAYQTELP